jgi:hypothetical protein
MATTRTAASKVRLVLAATLMEPFFFPPEDPEDPEGVELAAALALAADGVAVAMPFTPPVTGPLSVSFVWELPIFIAAAMKASKVFPESGAFTDPTIPMPQWVACLQWYHMGFLSSVILMVNSLAVCKPESNPAGTLPLAARYVQGAAKEDWVTEWEAAELGNQKVTRVPFGALIFAGWNVKVLLKKTSTFIWPAESAGAEGAAAGAAEALEALEAAGAVFEVEEESP